MGSGEAVGESTVGETEDFDDGGGWSVEAFYGAEVGVLESDLWHGFWLDVIF